MDRIAVDADRRAPGLAVVARRRNENIYVAIAVIAPRNIKIATVLAVRSISGIDANLGKAVGARDAGNAEVARTCGNDESIFAEGDAAIMGRSHHDAITLVPDRIKRAIRAHHAVKAFQRAVIIARQTGDAAQLDGL